MTKKKAKNPKTPLQVHAKVDEAVRDGRKKIDTVVGKILENAEKDGVEVFGQFNRGLPPPRGFNYDGPDMRMSDTVSKMLFGPVDPKRGVKKISVVVEYEKGPKQVLMTVGKDHGRIQVSNNLKGVIPRFEHLEEHVWPEFLEWTEKYELTVLRQMKVRPTPALAEHVKKTRGKDKLHLPEVFDSNC